MLAGFVTAFADLLYSGSLPTPFIQGVILTGGHLYYDVLRKKKNKLVILLIAIMRQVIKIAKISYLRSRKIPKIIVIFTII